MSAEASSAAAAARGGGLRGVFDRHVITPLIDLLRVGATPERLAWSMAVGIACGINPLLGSTTLVCLAVTAPLRLNLVASQIANHLCYPLELALFFVFIRAGDRLFGTGPIPMRRHALFESLHHHPWETTKLLWSWEWHALIVWLLVALALVPLLATLFTPLLRRLKPAQTATP